MGLPSYTWNSKEKNKTNHGTFGGATGENEYR
jgi:hypothetical protein